MKLNPPDIKSNTLNKFPKCEKNKKIKDFLGGGVIELGPFLVNNSAAWISVNPRLFCILSKSIFVLYFSAISVTHFKCSS